MSQEIKTSQAAVDSVSQVLREGVNTICAFRLGMLAGALPVSGSHYHDGTLATTLQSGLEAYRTMIDQDVSMVQGAHSSLVASDSSASSAF